MTRSRGESLELYRPPAMDRKTSPLLETLRRRGEPRT